MEKKQTPSQTVGPYFAYGLTPDQYGYPLKSIVHPKMVDKETPGEHIRIVGQVLDGNGKPINDSMIEIWQPNSKGEFHSTMEDNTFRGIGRVGTGTDPENKFWFETIKPGALDNSQAPFINVIVFMRGLLSHVYTRIYFSDEEEANTKDPVLNRIDKDRRHTLIAKRKETPAGVEYLFDVHMQGENETVFFDV